jgi:nucleotide-binding universal stress UspA family protein
MDKPRLTRILHATDFSRAAAPAFAHALRWARRWRAALHLVHVLSPPEVPLEDTYLSARAWQRAQEDAHRAARGRLGLLVALARRAGVPTTITVREGLPADEIVREARRRRAGLIVVGTHGRRGLARLALGSVAARVVTLAPCPVLTVHGRK